MLQTSKRNSGVDIDILSLLPQASEPLLQALADLARTRAIAVMSTSGTARSLTSIIGVSER